MVGSPVVHRSWHTSRGEAKYSFVRKCDSLRAGDDIEYAILEVVDCAPEKLEVDALLGEKEKAGINFEFK